MIRILPQSRLILTFFFTFLFLIPSFSQDNIVRGRVFEEAGTTLAGANIVIKGSSRGVTADASGNFAIAANQGETLVVSFVGYEPQEISVSTSNYLEIRLSLDTNLLQEVVVTGALGIERSAREVASGTQIISNK